MSVWPAPKSYELSRKVPKCGGTEKGLDKNSSSIRRWNEIDLTARQKLLASVDISIRWKGIQIYGNFYGPTTLRSLWRHKTGVKCQQITPVVYLSQSI